MPDSTLVRLPFANAPHHTGEIIGTYIFPIQVGTSTGEDGLPQMKYVTGAELQAFARKGLGEFAHFLGTLTELPESAAVNDYFLAGASFGDYVLNHYYEYNGTDWFDVSGVLSQFATAQSVADINVRLVAAEGDITDLQAKVDIAVAGITFRDSTADLTTLAAIVSPSQGDCYWVISEQAFYAWNGTAWRPLTASYFVVDSLDSTSTTNALSAAKGKELNDRMHGMDLRRTTRGGLPDIRMGAGADAIRGHHLIDAIPLEHTGEHLINAIPDEGGESQALITEPDVPASSSATGTFGQIHLSSDYLYICIADNTWRRVALSTF